MGDVQKARMEHENRFRHVLAAFPDARAIGFNSSVWFALKSDTIVYGIVELLGDGHEKATGEALLAVEQFGISLGRLIEQSLVRPRVSRRSVDGTRPVQ